jgi:para-nitrobenzyl esterase
VAVFRGVPFAAPPAGPNRFAAPAPVTPRAALAADAASGVDALLVFGITDINGEVTTAGPATLAASRRLAEVIRADHLAFAANGDPGRPRFRRHARRTRVYDPEPGLVACPEDRSRTIWRDRRSDVLDLRSRYRGSEPE